MNTIGSKWRICHHNPNPKSLVSPYPTSQNLNTWSITCFAASTEWGITHLFNLEHLRATELNWRRSKMQPSIQQPQGRNVRYVFTEHHVFVLKTGVHQPRGPKYTHGGRYHPGVGCTHIPEGSQWCSAHASGHAAHNLWAVCHKVNCHKGRRGNIFSPQRCKWWSCQNCPRQREFFHISLYSSSPFDLINVRRKAGSDAFEFMRWPVVTQVINKLNN